MGQVAEFMGQDHDRLDGIFREFQSTKKTDIQKAKSLFSEFKSGLQRHIGWEEKILFPIFEDANGLKEGGPTEDMRTEHRQIGNYLETIFKAVSNGNANTDDLEFGLLDVLSQHNHKEENLLYPWIDETLSEKQAEETIFHLKNSANLACDCCKNL